MNIELTKVHIHRRMNPDRKRHPFQQQHIRLTGLGSKDFDNFIENIHHIQMKFERQFPDGAIDKWSESMAFDTYLSIDIANRYFTPVHLAPNAKNASVNPTVELDPRGVMATILQQGQMLYLPDNIVLYFEKEVDRKNGSIKSVYLIH